jgi:DNA-binding NarL/FixJ family response regulator
MVKVMLVDDQRLFIEGLQAILSQEKDIEVVGLASNGLKILDRIGELKPDIIFMDLHMPDSNGIEATFQIKDRYPHIKVVLLTRFAEEELIVFGLNAGADGYLLKELERDQLIQAIRDVSYDEVVISGKAARILAKKIRDLKYNKKEILQERLERQHIYLTSRELDIAYLLMEGAINKVIAEKLMLSEGTIKNYISDVYHKLDIHNRKDVTRFLKKLVR